MKRSGLFLIAIAATALSCTVNCQSGKHVHGNHNVITTERNVGTFTGIKVSSGIDVYLKQGEPESVRVEADENLHEHIVTEVRSGILHVYSEGNIHDAETERVYVTMKEITSVQTTSAGDVVGESPLKAGDLELSASSAGDIKLEVNADKIEVDISSSGDITLKGETSFLEADLSSAGDLRAYELKAREADVSVSSAGNADINVTEKLTARASSAGDIHYTGNPTNVDAHTSSAGGVHKR